MSGVHSDLLNPDKALIFRITHRDNVPWILENGIYAKKGVLSDPNFRPIGNRDLIRKRTDHPVPIGPGGSLSDYIPFYFTPFSMMLYNIKTGHNGVPQVPNEEIVIIVSSLQRVTELKISFTFTDQHAYLATAEYFTSLKDLDRIDWAILQNQNFKRDDNDLGKTDRYQAEALIWRHLPVEGILGICCFTETVKDSLKTRADDIGSPVKIIKRSDWFFR